jgi:hypothetical protein
MFASNCRPTMPPPMIFTVGPTPSSFTARTIATDSGGYEQMNTMSGLAARTARMIDEKSTRFGG